MPQQRKLLILLVWIFVAGASYAQVNADFKADSETQGCGSLQAKFCSEASSTAGTITSLTWDLGGVNSSLECPGRIFGTAGTYTICLTAKDDQGNEATVCKDDFITILALPEPDFEADVTRGCAPMDVVFSDLSESTDGNITKYIWGLGGSNSVIEDDGSLSEVSSTYTIPDNYTVSLTVEDDNGCLNTVVKEQYIQASPNPEIEIALVDSISCAAPFDVSFINNSPANNVSFNWDFGNGNEFAGYQPPPVQYNEVGTYSITIEAVVPSTGCSTTLVLEDKVSIGYPVEFDVSSEEVCQGTELNFIDRSTFEADSILWDFGDGMTSTAVEVAHEYEDDGTYTVTLFRFLDGCPSLKEAVDLVTVLPEPAVSFANDNSAGCEVPHTVNFSGSSPNAENWLWDFGDGNTSTQRNPTHTFESFGEFDVSLTVTNAAGCTKTVTNVPINIATLEATIEIGTSDGCVPRTFTLTDASNSVVPITSWEWEIDGTTYTDSNPSVVLTDTGKYDVQLIIVNALGCRDTVMEPELLRVGDELSVDFDSDIKENCVDSPISFVDLSDDFADGWIWEFGDTALFEQNPVYEFPDTGIYDVTLTIFQNGCVSSFTKEDFITIVKPKARFKFENSCTDPFAVVFQSTSIGADRLEWDFGVEGVTTDTSSLVRPTFRFPTTGEYTVSLTAFNFDTDCSHTKEATVIITDPKADFNLSTFEGCAPLRVSVLDNSDFAADWTWSAPGGVVDDPTSAEPTITYSTPGAFSVIQLVITDVNECTDTLVYTDTIFVNGVNANFQVDPTGGCLPLDVNFTDQSTSVFGNNVSWEWNIGEGYANLEGEEADFVFEERGSYPVTLTVTDDWGCVGKRTVDGAVLVTQPIAQFSADTLSCTSAAIQFTNESEGVNLTYVWDFGDGNTSTEKDPMHMYTTEGVYTVCIDLTDVNGCTDRICRENYILIANPIANFSIGETYASCPPLIAEFDNNSQNSNTWEWDFGDNSGTADLENPPHVYTQPGTYSVSLVASSTPGCTDTLVLDDLIQLDGPVGSFEYRVDSTCVPVKITLIGESDDLYEYVWDMGNGDLIERPGRLDQDSVVYFYEEPGIYAPKLRLIDASTNCEVVVEPDGEVLVTDLIADFTALDTTLCGGELSTQFINLSNSNSPITFLEWSFEGASPVVSQELEPRVEFTGVGTFDVQIIAGNGFCRDTLIKEEFINIGEIPDAQLVATPDNGCEPFPVQFTDNSTVATGSIVSWQWNFGDEATSVEQNPMHTYTDGGDYPVELTVTSDKGCVAEATTIIPVEHAMEVFIKAVDPICIGEEVKLHAFISDTTRNMTVSWDNGSVLDCTDCVTPLASPADTTTFTVMVSNDDGCQNSASITVDVRPFRVPVVSLSSDTTICPSDFINLYVGGGEDVFDYDWDESISGLSCYENCANPIASPAVSTTYFVQVTGEGGCTSTDSVRVDVAEAFRPLAENETTICIGDTVQLNTIIGENPIWLNPNKLDCAYCPDPKAAPKESTTYRVEVTDEFGCQVQDSVRIDVVQLEDVDAGDNQDLCLGDEVVIEGKGVGSVTWSPNIGISSTSTLSPGLSPNVTTTYYMTVTNGECTLTDSVTIDIIDKTDVSLLGGTICDGETISLSANGDADRFTWIVGEEQFDNQGSTFDVSPDKNETVSVIAQLSTCESDTASATVQVVPLPDVYLSPSRPFFKDQSFDIGLDVKSIGNYTYEWLPADGLSCYDCPNPEVTPESDVDYQVIVTDNNTGCTYDQTIALKLISECSEEIIAMPNIFSPNNDGQNDILTMSTALVTQIERYQIFDRWGGLVFETNDLSQGWDGTSRGQTLQQGVYVYFIEAKCELDGKTFMKTGDVTLIK